MGLLKKNVDALIDGKANAKDLFDAPGVVAVEKVKEEEVKEEENPIAKDAIRKYREDVNKIIKAIDIEDLIYKGFVIVRLPVIGGIFDIKIKSLSLRRVQEISEIAKKQEASAHEHQVMNLAEALVGTFVKGKENPVPDDFDSRYKLVNEMEPNLVQKMVTINGQLVVALNRHIGEEGEFSLSDSIKK